MKLRLFSFALLLSVGSLIGHYFLAGAPPNLFTVTHAQGPGISSPCDGRQDFHIGSGIYDITGPAAGLGMMGYAQVGQKTGGIHFRLWSRAFVIESPCNGKRVVFVSADLLAIFQSVKKGVVEKLRTGGYGDRYNDDNVLISATHDHSGPGGYSHYKLYNLTIGGFDQQNFDAIVDGIYESIVRADKDLAPGTIRVASGETRCAQDNLEVCKTDPNCVSRNRSPDAYLKNPADERANYDCNTDNRMTLLRFAHQDGREIGEINWFAVHGTSMHNDNHLISGDNKGYASYRFERSKGSDYDSAHTFVAAFAQSNEGDVSPNLCGGTDGCGRDQFDSTRLSGERQLTKALELYHSAADPLIGAVDYRHEFVKMSSVEVKPQPAPYGDGLNHQTCPSAIGLSMIAGAEDGPGFGWQGLSCAKLPKWLEFLCNGLSTECQRPKPIAVQTGLKDPPWTPQVLPIQLLEIGDLVIIAVPAEFTTMAGRRLRNTVSAQLKSAGIRYCVIAGLSNAYSGYVTTHQEYSEQRYEGASTHFGPWTLAAYQQEFERLAIALRDGKWIDPGPTPDDPPLDQIHLSAPERKLPWKHFGDVHRDAKAIYHPGETVKVSFWAGHPRNDLRTQGTYLIVQRQDGNTWISQASDRDWETKFVWRTSIFGTFATVEWVIPPGTPLGFYRIRHDGAYRSQGKMVQYSGWSKVFRVS